MNTLVIGVGNPDRGDDAAGLAVARRLAAERAPGVEVIEWDGDPLGLLQAWKGRDEVRVVDATCGAGPPGSLSRCPLPLPLPSHLRPASTHALGLAMAVELARALDALPGQLVIHGIEGRDFRPGEPLSSEARQGVDETVELLLRETHGNGGNVS